MPYDKNYDPFFLPGGQGENAILAHIATSLKRIADNMDNMNWIMTRMVFEDGSLRVSTADDPGRNAGERWK